MKLSTGASLLEKKLDKGQVRSRKKINLVRLGLLNGVICSILLTKFLVSALLTDGNALLEFNRYNEMHIEAVLIPFFTILNIYVIKILYNRLSIEYDMSYYDLAQYFLRKHKEAIGCV